MFGPVPPHGIDPAFLGSKLLVRRPQRAVIRNGCGGNRSWVFSTGFGPVSRGRFAKAVAAELRRAGETADFRYDAKESRLVSTGDETHQVNLGNTYREYLDAPKTKASGCR